MSHIRLILIVWHGQIDARKRRLSLGLKESLFKGGDGSLDKGKTKVDHDDKETNDENGGSESEAMDDSDEERESSKRSREVFESGHENAFSLDFGESGSSGVRAGNGSSSSSEEEDDVGDSDDDGGRFG